MSSLTPLTSYPAGGPLSGDARLPGDKSISHRAIMLGGLAVGESEIHGLLEGGDVLATARAMATLGARVERVDGQGGHTVWRVNGVGLGGLKEPATTLDMGNSGTGARLLMGVVASHPITCQFTGDESLCARPMGRIATPLEAMGARIIAREGCRMPLTIIGCVLLFFNLPSAAMLFLPGWGIIGVVIYVLYSRRRSHLGQGIVEVVDDVAGDETMVPIEPGRKND